MEEEVAWAESVRVTGSAAYSRHPPHRSKRAAATSTLSTSEDRLDRLMETVVAVRKRPTSTVLSVNDAFGDRRKRATRGTGTPPMCVQAVAAAAWGDWDACLLLASRWHAAGPHRTKHLLHGILQSPVKLEVSKTGLGLVEGIPKLPIADLPLRLMASLPPLLRAAVPGPAGEPVWDDVLPEKPHACHAFSLSKCVWNRALAGEMPRAHLVRALLWCVGPGAPAFLPTLLRTAAALARERTPEGAAQAVLHAQTAAALVRAPPHSVPQAIATCEVNVPGRGSGDGMGYVSILKP